MSYSGHLELSWSVVDIIHWLFSESFIEMHPVVYKMFYCWDSLMSADTSKNKTKNQPGERNKNDTTRRQYLFWLRSILIACSLWFVQDVNLKWWRCILHHHHSPPAVNRGLASFVQRCERCATIPSGALFFVPFFAEAGCFCSLITDIESVCPVCVALSVVYQ